MTTIYSKIKQKLELYPHFRERKNRGIGLMKMSLRDCGLYEKWEVAPLTIEELLKLAKNYDSHRHQWDKIMVDYPEIRGTDYEDKDQVVQNKLLDFGYEPGYKLKIDEKN